MAKKKTQIKRKPPVKRGLSKEKAKKQLDAVQSIGELIPVAEKIKAAGGLKLEADVANRLTMLVHYRKQ